MLVLMEYYADMKGVQRLETEAFRAICLFDCFGNEGWRQCEDYRGFTGGQIGIDDRGLGGPWRYKLGDSIWDGLDGEGGPLDDLGREGFVCSAVREGFVVYAWCIS